MTGRSLALVALLLGVAIVGAAPALAQATASIDDGSLPMAADEQQVVNGETGLEPGTELTVRLRSSDSSAPFLRQQTAYVSDNGTFAAVFDMSSVAANTTFDLTVLQNGTTLLETTSRTVACDGNCTDPVPDLPEPPEPDPTPESTSGTEAFAVGADDSFGFERSVYSSRQGEVVSMTVALDDAETAVVVIGGRENGYQVNATITDGNGDGSVELRFDTAAAGRTGTTFTAESEADSVSVVPGSEIKRDTYIDADDYELALYRGTDASGTPDDVSTLSLKPGTVETQLSVTEGTDAAETRTPSSTAGLGALALGGVLAVAGVALAARSILS